MAVPLYNGEISPPEVRGSLVALQQMAIVTGIMVRTHPLQFSFRLLTHDQFLIGLILD